MLHHKVIEFSAMPKTSEETEQAETDYTERVLLSLVFDVACLAENVEQVKVKVLALAREHGIRSPK
jgi:hypothetical protein